jgi:hypothetical protein
MTSVEDQVRRLGGVEVPELPDVTEVEAQGVRHRNRFRVSLAVMVIGISVAAGVIVSNQPTSPSVSVDEPEPAPTTTPEPQPATVAVPSLIGLAVDPAQAALGEVGLVPVVEPVVLGDVPPVVLNQEPAPGSVVPAGSTVTLRVGLMSDIVMLDNQLSGERWTIVDHGGSLVVTLDGVEVWNDRDWVGAPEANRDLVPRRLDGNGIRLVFGRLPLPGPDRGVIEVRRVGSEEPLSAIAYSPVSDEYTQAPLWAVEVPPGVEVEVVYHPPDGSAPQHFTPVPLVPGT